MKLVGGETAASGNVYFMSGPVCDDSWDLEDGHVVCRELGFPSALEVTKGSAFGPVYRDFTADNVRCTGEEAGLEECQRKDAGQSFCSGQEAAGVVCSTGDSEEHARVKRFDPATAQAAGKNNISLSIVNIKYVLQYFNTVNK